MHLSNARSPRALVQPSIYRRRNGQSTANDGADARQEACEGLWSGFAVDDFHGGYVVGEEDTGDTASIRSVSMLEEQ